MEDTFFKNKRILVTGACGTVGSEIIRLMLENTYDPEEVVGLDNNESGLFFLEQKFLKYPHAHFSLADIRDYEKLRRKMKGIDIVFHAAAFKHVVLCERSPYEAVQTNIHGVQNIINAAIDSGVERVIFCSSDKAVNPTNVMGTSKLMGERLITAANSNYLGKGTIFASTRFGNVLGSSGSVIPIFKKQIEQGGPVTLTDPSMTRFVMSIEQAVRLVLASASLAKGGEVFITKMPIARIEDLARVMIRHLAPLYGIDKDEIELATIGMKPGEKLYEELMSSEEIRRAVELADYFVVLPAFRGLYRMISYDYEDQVSGEVTTPYNSNNDTALTESELHDFLITNNLLEPTSLFDEQPAQRYWPGEEE